MTILTVIVPAYNSESTLHRCLDSLVCDSLHDSLQVIVVNDGSTDRTLEIATQYSHKYPHVQVLNKANGGHGSTINQGVIQASGAYFKVLDSDDLFNTQDLQALIEELRSKQADVILTNFRTIDPLNRLLQKFELQGVRYGELYNFDDFWQTCCNTKEMCAFHSITYRTAFYRNCDIMLSEGISYEDQEFSTIPFKYSPSVLPLDLWIYEYTLGYENQSMSPDNQVRKINELEHVFWTIQKSAITFENRFVAAYFKQKLGELLIVYYMTALLKNPDKKQGRQLTRQLRKKLEKEAPALLIASNKSYRLFYLVSLANIQFSSLIAFQNNRSYKKIGRFIRT